LILSRSPVLELVVNFQGISVGHLVFGVCREAAGSNTSENSHLGLCETENSGTGCSGVVRSGPCNNAERVNPTGSLPSLDVPGGAGTGVRVTRTLDLRRENESLNLDEGDIYNALAKRL
jgi:hypothetical protein